MPETTPLIKAALNLRVGVGFDVYRFLLFFNIILDESIGSLVIYTLPYRVAIGLHRILQ